MSGRLRWNHNGGQSTFQSAYGYDEHLANEMRKDNARRKAIMDALPLHKKELINYENGCKNRVRAKKKAEGYERVEAEQRMAEAVRKVVEILEFHMNAMMAHRRVTGRPCYVNQERLHNVIVDLRCKCGVLFNHNPEYGHREPMDKSGHGRVAHPSFDPGIPLMEQQRAARARKMREITDRLIARAKK